MESSTEEKFASRRPVYLDTVGVTGSNPVARMDIKVFMFAYTYGLRCSDGNLCGFDNRFEAPDQGTRRRVGAGNIVATACEIVYYEAWQSPVEAPKGEVQLKTGFGRRYLKGGWEGEGHTSPASPPAALERSSCGLGLREAFRAGVEPCIAHHCKELVCEHLSGPRTFELEAT